MTDLHDRERQARAALWLALHGDPRLRPHLVTLFGLIDRLRADNAHLRREKALVWECVLADDDPPGIMAILRRRARRHLSTLKRIFTA